MCRPDKGAVEKINEILLYALIVEFQLYGSVWAMLNVTGIPYMFLYWGFVGLGLIKLCIQRNNWKEWLFTAFFGVLAICCWRSSLDKAPLLMMLAVCCSKHVKLDRVIKIDLIARLVSTSIMILFPLFGICENKMRYEREVNRIYFGWEAPNGMGLAFLVIGMEWMYLRHRRFRWFDYSGIAAMILLLHFTANSRSSELLLALILFVEATGRLRERYMKRLEEYRLWTLGCVIALPVSLLVPLLALLWYRFGKDTLMRLEGTFIARFQFPGMLWAEHGLTLFGSPYDSGFYNYLDMFFAYLIIHLGVLMAAVFLILIARAIWYGYKKKDEKLMLFLLIILIRGMVESEHFNFVYAFFPVLLGMAFWDWRIWKQKDGKEQ